ncbi:MAG: carboxypeptidase-like regulatory domain-containing protein [Saprospiraceae bacterium]|nr:carboxypeptidase-like regulatory domain-containing protein [Saprospiraceae bacterium]
MNNNLLMWRLLWSFCMVISFARLSAQEIEVTGKVSDATTGEELIGAAIGLLDATGGAVTNYEGRFTVKVPALPVTLRISYTGYETQEVTVQNAGDRLDIRLQQSALLITETVVTGQRIDEKQKAAPLTVEKLDAIAIKETPAINFYNGLGNLKGVDLTTASLGFTIINTRGFNSTSPVRSLQLIDGVDNQAPGLNFSLGNFLGASDLDVNSVELIQGASSAFYGPNAFNGVISMETKDPFIHKGIAASARVGERELFDGAVRWADAFRNKNGQEFFAAKLNFYYLQAYDWVADNYDPVYESRSAADNPGRFDAVNIYGDEYQALYDRTGDSPWSPSYGMQVYHRTGYREVDLVDYNTQNIKANTALHFRLNPAQGFESQEIIFASSFGSGTTVYQGDNRFSLRDILFFQNRLEWRKKDKFFLRAYATNEDAGNSFDPYFTALRLQEASKTDKQFADDYRNHWVNTGKYNQRMIELGYPQLVFDPITFEATFDDAAANQWFIDYQDSLAAWHAITEQVSNQESRLPGVTTEAFFEPGTDRFEQEFNRITSTKSGAAGGTRFFDKSALYHTQGEYIFTPGWLNYWRVGGNVRWYRPYSEGTIFSDTLQYTRDAQGNPIDSSYERITNFEFGMYTGVEKRVMDDKIILGAALRADKNQNFDWIATPAASIVYNPNPKDFYRLSFSAAVRNPTLTDQYLLLDVGRATLLGNLNGFDSLVTVESLTDALTENSLARLEYFNVAPIMPEKVRTIELGYRSTWWEHVYVDAGYYFSLYKDFIGYNIGVDVPVSAGLIDVTNIEAYRVAANSTNTVTTQGFNIGLNYFFNNYYQFSGNYSWNKLTRTDENDPIIPAFNTPEHKFNIGFSWRDLPMFGLKRTGFNVTYKWIQGFIFEGSPQFTGFIPTYDMVDAQWNVTFERIHTTLKLGATNLFGIVPIVETDGSFGDKMDAAFNNRQFQTYGGPRIGRMAYIGLTYDFRKK